MKKIIYFMISILALLSITDKTYSQKIMLLDKIVEVEEILNVAIGQQRDQIDYSLRDNDKIILSKVGVECFTVDNQERVYISNFAAGKIKVFQNQKLINELELQDITQPLDLEISQGLLYILEDTGKINVFNTADNSYYTDYSVQPYLEKKEDINRELLTGLMKAFNDNLITVYADNSLNSVSKQKNIKLNINKFKIPGFTGEIYKYIIGRDKFNNLFVLGTRVINIDNQIDIEEIIFKFDSSGKLLGILPVINTRNYIVPFNYLYVNELGNIYQLLLLKDEVKIFRLSLISDYSFKAEEETMKENINDNNNPLFRETVYNRAKDMATYSWVYNPTDQQTSSKIKAPLYLERINQSQEVTGIPYCWGGYDSLTTKTVNQSWENFPDALNSKAIIGNVGVESYYVSNTAGLDCSGFISAVLGLEKRQPSWKFIYDSSLASKISYNQLKKMDMIVRDGHILFYLSRNSFGINSLEANCLGSEWRVKFYGWSWRALRDNGYQARRYN